MKIARVFIQEYPGRQIGEIHDVFSPENHPGSILSGTLMECEVADDFDMTVLKGELHLEKWSKEGEADVYVDPEDESWTRSEGQFVVFVSDPVKVAAKVAAQKTKDVTDRYDEMNADIFAEMEQVFGTQRSDSATAYHETWQLMKAKPILFWEQGLTVHVAHGTFQVGDALDTIQKVEDYAEAALAAVEAYAVMRMNRIKQFQDERAAILAG